MLSKPIKTLTQIALASVVLAGVVACAPGAEEQEEGSREREGVVEPRVGEREKVTEREGEEEKEEGGERKGNSEREEGKEGKSNAEKEEGEEREGEEEREEGGERKGNSEKD